MPTAVTVTGNFFAGPGVAATGRADWQLSAPMFDSGGRLVCTTEVVSAPITNGQMSVQLWANDDNDVTPPGTHWTLTVWLAEGNPGSVITYLKAEFTETYVIRSVYAPTIDISQLPQPIPIEAFVPSLLTNLDGGAASAKFLTSGPMAQILDGGAVQSTYLTSNVLDGGTV